MAYTAKICSRYKKCPKACRDKCGCSEIHKCGCTATACERFPKERVPCREATEDEIMLAEF